MVYAAGLKVFDENVLVIGKVKIETKLEMIFTDANEELSDLNGSN